MPCCFPKHAAPSGIGRRLQARTGATSHPVYFLISFSLKAEIAARGLQISPSSSGGGWDRGGGAERHINGEERAKEEREGWKKEKKKSQSVSFELMSPCWAGFDIQTMRQGSTQGGRLPCNINSHLRSSCGCGHQTLKETAAMDPQPSHHSLPPSPPLKAPARKKRLIFLPPPPPPRGRRRLAEEKETVGSASVPVLPPFGFSGLPSFSWVIPGGHQSSPDWTGWIWRPEVEDHR